MPSQKLYEICNNFDVLKNTVHNFLSNFGHILIYNGSIRKFTVLNYCFTFFYKRTIKWQLEILLWTE